MNRDALFATAIGFSIGLVITGFIILGPGLVERVSKLSIRNPVRVINPTVTPKVVQNSNPTFTISSPGEGEIVINNSLIISGTAFPGSLVVMQGIGDDIATKVDESGKFAVKATLSLGKNEISLGMYPENGEVVYKTISVFYTPEDF